MVTDPRKAYDRWPGHVEAGFAVREMGEWRAEGDEHPRLLTIRFDMEPHAAGS